MPARVAAPVTSEQGGRRLGPLLCWAVVFADIGTSVYYTPGILFGQVGTHAALFVAMTLIVFVLLTVKYAEVAIRYPEGGGVVTVASHAIHPFAGLVGGLLILVDYFLTASLSALSGIIYLTVVAGPLKPFVLAATIAALILLGLLNLVGVSASAQVTAAFAAVALIGQLAVVVAVVIHLGPAGVAASIPRVLAGPHIPPLGLLTGFAGAFLAFSGLESIAQLAPSMAEPRKRVAPVAMGMVVVTVAITSPLLTLWATTLLNAKDQDPNQFISLLGGYAAGPIFAVSIAISGALLLVFASNTALIGTYNVFLALARMRFLPQVLTATNRWRRTPHWSIVVATAIPIAVVAATAGNVGLLGDLYAFGLLGAFTLTCIALDLVRYHERGEKHRSGPRSVNVGRTRFLLGLLTTFLVGGAWITNLFAKPLATLFGGLVMVAGGAIALLTYRLSRRGGRSAIFPHVHSPRHPVVLMSRGRRLPRADVLAILPHQLATVESVVREAAAAARGGPIVFAYAAHPSALRRLAPRLLEIVDPYLEDSRAQEVLSAADRIGERLGLNRRYLYIPAIAEDVDLDWLAGHLAPRRVIGRTG